MSKGAQSASKEARRFFNENADKYLTERDIPRLVSFSAVTGILLTMAVYADVRLESPLRSPQFLLPLILLILLTALRMFVPVVRGKRRYWFYEDIYRVLSDPSALTQTGRSESDQRRVYTNAVIESARLSARAFWVGFSFGTALTMSIIIMYSPATLSLRLLTIAVLLIHTAIVQPSIQLDSVLGRVAGAVGNPLARAKAGTRRVSTYHLLGPGWWFLQGLALENLYDGATNQKLYISMIGLAIFALGSYVVPLIYRPIVEACPDRIDEWLEFQEERTR